MPDQSQQFALDPAMFRRVDMTTREGKLLQDIFFHPEMFGADGAEFFGRSLATVDCIASFSASADWLN